MIGKITYEQVEEILNEIRSKYVKGMLVLVSAGPCGKVIVYRLVKENIRCI